MKTLKCNKIKKISLEKEKQSSYDITVKDVHHYILGNGIISHNTLDLFPKDVMKGGCLTGGIGIQTRNGLKCIEDITKGDYVLTLDGYEEVLETHIFKKETIQFELEDGQIITCSKNHKFLISQDFTNINSWKTANELNENDIILSL